MADLALLTALDALVEPVIGEDPMSPLLWTSKSCAKLATELTARGHSVVGPRTVVRFLRQLDYSLQGTVKIQEGGSHPYRDAQFRRISRRVRAFMKLGQSVISVDGKTKELIGDFA